MKKSVLSLLAVAFAAVSVFTSCDKSNDGYETPSNNVQGTSASETPDNSQKYNCISYFVDDQMAANATWTVSVTDGTKTSEYDLVAQGKHGNYNLSQDADMQSVSGYVFTIALPMSNNAVKASVKYTLKDGAKVTEDAKMDMRFGRGSYTSTTANPDANGRLYAVKLLGTQCDHIDEAYSTVCSFMAIN